MEGTSSRSTGRRPRPSCACCGGRRRTAAWSALGSNCPAEPLDQPAHCDHILAREASVSPSSFRRSSQAYQESLPRVGDEQEIEKRHPKKARRLQTPYLHNRAQFGKASEEQFMSMYIM